MIILPSMYDTNRHFLIREDRTEISFYIDGKNILRESKKLTPEERAFIKDELINTQTYESKINPQ